MFYKWHLCLYVFSAERDVKEKYLNDKRHTPFDNYVRHIGA